MRPINFEELKVFSEKLNALSGARAQEIVVGEKCFGISLWHQGLYWLWVDLNPLRPLPILLTEVTPKYKKEVKPLGLFLRAHVRGQVLHHSEVQVEKGRILYLFFSSNINEEPPTCVELRLFPHGQNVIASAAGKCLSWSKVKPLPPSLSESVECLVLRQPAEMLQEWLLQKENQNLHKKVDVIDEDVVQKYVQKREKAIAKVKEDIAKKQNNKWFEAGMWIKTHLNIEVPEELKEFVDPKLNVSRNIERCFIKNKEIKRKINEATKRLVGLEAELSRIQKGELPQESKGVKIKTKKGEESPRLRRLILPLGKEAYLGKSARDNLSLLRHSQPWDYWLHLKDFPGAHGIIRRARGVEVLDREFVKVAQWVAKESAHKPGAPRTGDSVDVVIVECRYVKPIKGDEIGRVTYHNEKVICVKI